MSGCGGKNVRHGGPISLAPGNGPKASFHTMFAHSIIESIESARYIINGALDDASNRSMLMPAEVYAYSRIA